MKRIIKALVGIVSVGIIFLIVANTFGRNSGQMTVTPVITAFAGNAENSTQAFASLQDALQGAETALQGAETAPQAETEQPQILTPYPQVNSLFPNMDMQYAYLLLQQGLEKSHLAGHSLLTLENGNEFVIRCWSEGMGLEITEALADNKTRLDAWEQAVNNLWDLDAILSRDIKETLGTDKSVTIQIVDDVRPEAVLLKIKDGKIEYNLFRDGTGPKYEVYGAN
ncbi:MAG: hypothetical protein IJQ21_03520 [Lachnospiraceae bacterium]|nr:hypothetical protein [Lachnospiraceae bacterium]